MFSQTFCHRRVKRPKAVVNKEQRERQKQLRKFMKESYNELASILHLAPQTTVKNIITKAIGRLKELETQVARLSTRLAQVSQPLFSSPCAVVRLTNG